MSGAIGLHGGGEYLAGDEPFLDALLIAAARSPRRNVAGAAATEPDHSRPSPIRVVVVPTAAGRGRPDQAAANGVDAFERRAAALGLSVKVAVARVVDGPSATESVFVDHIRGADLIHLPGGDPDLIPRVLAGSAVLDAIREAWRAGAVLAGASAGAMALAEWTWTPQGGLHGLGFVPGLAVVPHYDEIRRTTWQPAIERLAPGGIGYLGLDERTGILAEANGTGERRWVVAGPGAAWWFARGASEPLVARSGETLRIPG
jgi:cyanophycinase-like exopeptidase